MYLAIQYSNIKGNICNLCLAGSLKCDKVPLPYSLIAGGIVVTAALLPSLDSDFIVHGSDKVDTCKY